MKLLLFAFLAAILAACSPAHKTATNVPTADIKELRFINAYILPNGMHLKNTIIGGLSGIDYDASMILLRKVQQDIIALK